MVLLIYLFLSIHVAFKIVYIYINDNIFPLVDCDLDVVWGLSEIEIVLISLKLATILKM